MFWVGIVLGLLIAGVIAVVVIRRVMKDIKDLH